MKLKYGASEGALQLENSRVHLSTIKAMFGLSNVGVDGAATPADDRGFTFVTYLSEVHSSYLGFLLQVCPTPVIA